MYKKVWFVFIVFIGWIPVGAQQGSSNTLANDSVTMAASTRYRNPSFFEKLFLGKNYRRVWSQPVKLPVFWMKAQGFSIKEMGGGQQTTSLKLNDAQRQEWALRSVDKNVKPVAVPPALRKKFVINVVQDMISAGFPYAPAVITPLANATGVIAPDVTFYFVPDDAAFGAERKKFAEKVFMLENREIAMGDKNESVEEIVEELMLNNKIKIDAPAVLRARLLDMLIADWDRHQDQWRFGVKDSAGSKWAYAIPRDRDQALFLSTGLLVKIARPLGLRHMEGFNSRFTNATNLSAKSWNFDRLFLSSLSASDWQRITAQFQQSLPDAVIDNAARQLPPEIYALTGNIIAQKLKSRRNSLDKAAMRYYRFLAKHAMVLGSDASEQFTITGNRDSITVTRYNKKDGAKVFERTFYKKETYNINLIGLGGDDTFTVEEGARSRIRLHIDGGKGDNQYNIGNGIKHKIYNSNEDAASYKKTMKQFLRIKE